MANRLKGEQRHNTKHSNAVVERAKQLRRDGLSYGAIGYLVGANPATVARWVSGEYRK